MAKRKYVIDTSVYLTEHQSINKFGIHDIIVPLKVLEEIDNHKKRQAAVGADRQPGSPHGIVRVRYSQRPHRHRQNPRAESIAQSC